MITSLRKLMDAEWEELLRATVAAWRNSLSAMAKSAERAVPAVGDELSVHLLQAKERLTKPPTAKLIAETERFVESELILWEDRITTHLRQKASEVREILLFLASAADSVDNRDKRYARRFKEVTSRLQGMANLDDLTSIRQQLTASVTEMYDSVAKMEQEGQSAIVNLRAQVEMYRTQLAEAERREVLDPLTGLTNRRGIETAIDARREQRHPFCIVLLDLNGFKETNDRYGHLAGDELLKQFSTELRTHFSGGSVIGRWGGDEFVVISGMTAADTNAAIARTRKWAFGEYRVETPQRVCHVPLSAAIGLAIWDGKESAMKLVSRADAAMYRDKKSENAPSPAGSSTLVRWMNQKNTIVR